MPATVKDEKHNLPPEENQLRRAVLVAVLLGLLMSLLMWNLAVQATYDGHITPPQLDSLMYFQYARALAEGVHAFLESGEDPTYGGVGHLVTPSLASYGVPAGIVIRPFFRSADEGRKLNRVPDEAERHLRPRYSAAV